MSKFSRRDFMKSTMAAGAAMAMLNPTSRVLGANDRLRMAVVVSSYPPLSHDLYSLTARSADKQKNPVAARRKRMVEKTKR